jgi:hypothetical protein
VTVNNDWCKPDPNAAQLSYPDADLSMVNLSDPFEIRRWCQRFVCTESQLRAAVANAGSDPAKVGQWLVARQS